MHVEQLSSDEETSADTHHTHDVNEFDAYSHELDGESSSSAAMASELLRGTTGAEGGESLHENTAVAVDHPWAFSDTSGTSAVPVNPNVVEEKEDATGGVTAEEHLKTQSTARAKRDTNHREASMVGEAVQADVDRMEHVSGEASSSNSLEAQDEQEEQEYHVREELVTSGTFATVLSMHMR